MMSIRLQTPRKIVGLFVIGVAILLAVKPIYADSLAKTKFYNRNQRHYLLEKAGLVTEAQKLDELDQDLLLLRAQRVSTTELAQIYPLLSRTKLERLQLFLQRASSDFKKIDPPLDLNAYSNDRTPVPKKDTSIVFFDLNFSVNELQAARRFARERGEQLFIFPERTEADENDLASQWRQVSDLTQRRNQCWLNQGGNCSKIERQSQLAEEEFDKRSAKISRLHAQDFLNIIAQIAQNTKVSMMIFSGHSSGRSFGGIFGSIDFQTISSSFQAHPAVLKDLTTVLLWGCYTGTLYALYNLWRKTFETIPLFAGYEKQSPLGTQEEGAQYMSAFVRKESQLRQTKSLQKVHKIFRSIPGTADLDATALIGDYFLTYDDAFAVKDMTSRCDSFPEKLYSQYQCYDFGREGCENPPANHQGPLREFYNFIQVNRHCINLFPEKHPRTPTPDYLIRLIYADNFKKNFKEHHLQDLVNYRDLLDQAQLPQEYAAENFLDKNRAENVRMQKDFLNLLLRLGMEDTSISAHPRARQIIRLNNANMTLRFALGLAKNLFNETVFDSNLNEECTPFGWVDIGSSEKDSCGFNLQTGNPPSPQIEQDVESVFLFNQMLFVFNEKYPDFLPINYTLVENKDQLKRAQIEALRVVRDLFQGREAHYSPTLRKKIESYSRQADELESASPDEVLKRVQAELEIKIQFVTDQIAELDPKPNGNQRLLSYLNSYKIENLQLQELLRKF